MRSWTRFASSDAVLRDRLAPVVDLADRGLDRTAALAQFALDAATALAQFALDAHAGFANLALEAVARGDAATLEAAQLRLGLGRRRVGRDRVAHARDDTVAGDQGGADRDQHGALGVVADELAGVARRALERGALGCGACARGGRVRAAFVRVLRRGVVRVAVEAFADAARRALRAFVGFAEVVLAVGIWRGSPLLLASGEERSCTCSPIAARAGDRTPVCNPSAGDRYSGSYQSVKTP